VINRILKSCAEGWRTASNVSTMLHPKRFCNIQVTKMQSSEGNFIQNNSNLFVDRKQTNQAVEAEDTHE